MKSVRDNTSGAWRVRIALVFLLCTISPVSHALDWADLWKTPTQRARAQLDNGELEALADDAPSDAWSGLANYRAGDFDVAGERFAAAREQHSESGDAEAALAATYNQANAALKSRRFQDALALYNDVLAQDPSHADALHNQTIAEQALELQQQQQEPQPQSGEQSDQPQDGDESGEQSQGSESGDQSPQPGDESESTEGEQNDSDDPSQSDNAGANSDGSSPQADDQQQGVDSPDEQEERDADAALAASADEEEPTATEDEGELLGLSDSELPLTESEQATEQWLRRIPDNPAGLLRRKLEQSHLNEYPEVGNSARPW